MAKSLGASSVSQSQFKQNSRISLSAVTNTFGNWNKAIESAGLNPIPSGPQQFGPKQSDEEYLLELIRLTREIGKTPTIAEMRAFGRFSEHPYRMRWNSLQAACQVAYSTYGYPEPTASTPENPESSNVPFTPTPPIKPVLIPQTFKPLSTERRKKIQYGEPLDFRGLRFAPINEQGVVYFFGMISLELGFLIESIRTAFPDCEGKRCVDSTRQCWEHVLIEFEYQSRNFLEHGHRPEECDLIVCWIHDWEDCPLEVLELRSVIKSLPSRS